MNNLNQKLNNFFINCFKSFGISFLVTLTGSYTVIAGQEFTGKIVIDGEVYGENNANIIKGNGIPGKEKRTVEEFQKIKILGGVNVNYQRGKNIQVEVSGDQNLLPIITTTVSKGTLIISSSKNYQTQLDLTVTLSSPKLSDVSQDGSGDMKLQGLNDDSLNLIISGSGNAIAQGTVKKLVVRINGAGDVNAKNLESAQADVSITGSGDIKVNAKDLLKASITGSGDISYFGNPKKVEPRILGSGDIEAGD